MTELTDDQVKSLLDGATPGPWAYEPHGDTGDYGVGVCYAMSDIELAFPLSGQVDSDVMVYDPICPEVAGQGNAAIMAAAPDIARALLSTRAELARVRADAAAAQAMMVERCAEEADRHYAAGDMGNPGHHIRALADLDGLAMVQELRAERDRVAAINVKHCEAVNTLLVDGARLDDRAKAAEAERDLLAAENARIRAAQPDWLQNCVVCKRVVDTREQADGGDPHGSGDADGGWVCSIECAEVQHPSPPPADGWTWHERLGWIGPDGKPADPRRRG